MVPHGTARREWVKGTFSIPKGFESIEESVNQSDAPCCTAVYILTTKY